MLDAFMRDWRAWPGRSAFDMEPFGGLLREPMATGIYVDIGETDRDVEITAELPGMDENDIEVLLHDDVLTIKGEKKSTKEDKTRDYHISERRYGGFQRSFRMPEGADAGKLKASFIKGVLTIKCPKTRTAAKTRKIAVSRS